MEATIGLLYDEISSRAAGGRGLKRNLNLAPNFIGLVDGVHLRQCDVDVIFSAMGHDVSRYAFALALVSCARKRYKRSNTAEILNR